MLSGTAGADQANFLTCGEKRNGTTQLGKGESGAKSSARKSDRYRGRVPERNLLDDHEQIRSARRPKVNGSCFLRDILDLSLLQPCDNPPSVLPALRIINNRDQELRSLAAAVHALRSDVQPAVIEFQFIDEVTSTHHKLAPVRSTKRLASG
jgi:hypothetical protein